MAPQLELPKLSTFTRILAIPEEYFQNTVKSIANIDIPPGPQSLLLKLQESVEAGQIPSVAPKVQLPRLEEILARFPALPEILPQSSEEKKPEAVEQKVEQKIEVVKPKTPEVFVF
ncbi:MAG: hypothetical protein QXW40_05955 [Thermofilum sp.]